MSNLTYVYYAYEIYVKCMTVHWQIYVQLSLSRRDLFAEGIPCMLPQMILRGEAFSKQTQSDKNLLEYLQRKIHLIP